MKKIHQRSWQVSTIHFCLRHPEAIKKFPKFIRPQVRQAISLYGVKA